MQIAIQLEAGMVGSHCHIERAEELGHEVTDPGACDPQECDYPDSAAAVAECVL